MPLVASKIELNRFNVTEEVCLFSDSKYGALYIPPDEGFSEISQSTLKQLVKANNLNPLKDYEKKYLEFFPDDIFIERSFKELKDAEQFIRGFFEHFEDIHSFYCEGVISKLHRFVSISPSNKKVHCRIELVSGDSCKKFHVDNVESRLIYTCAGPGTQIKHPNEDEFETLPTGSALIVKGQKYPEFELTTLHRSPPIAKSNTKRLLFIADYL